MSRGRKPKPTDLKILAGAQPCRVNSEEPKPRAGRPPCPDRFGEATKAEWGRLCDELESLGVLNESHGFALAIYCGAYARLLTAEAALEEHGAFIESRGALKANPAASIAAQCETIMTRILTEFGLTAASVSKVKSQAEPPRDALAELLARRKAR